MKKIFILIAILITIIILIILLLPKNLERRSNTNMKIKSVFEQGKEIPKKYTCDGEDINPPLEITDAPENTKSFVLIVDDPDAPVGTWTHWVVWNIKNPKIEEGKVPEGAKQGLNDFRKTDYGGPCPPSGRHRYFFKVYALDTELEIEEGAYRKDVEHMMKGHILDQAELMGTYSRE